MLDNLGGLALFNFRGSRLRFASGLDCMASLHMTDRPVLRWYASCCMTPLFNSYATSVIPFLDICTAAIPDKDGLAAVQLKTRHLFTQSALGDTSDLPKTSPIALILRTTPRLVKEWVSGGRKRNPLFDAATGQPIAPPRRVSPQERAALQ